MTETTDNSSKSHNNRQSYRQIRPKTATTPGGGGVTKEEDDGSSVPGAGGNATAASPGNLAATGRPLQVNKSGRRGGGIY